MNQLWALKDIQQEVTIIGMKIVMVTFQPCHLWMRWSLIEPKQHIIPVLKRGVPFHADKYFCFDSYHDNEQAEAGDTLTHTFIKQPWAHCETRWFYFWGTIGGEASPSESPIFKKHRVYTEPPPPVESNDLYTLGLTEQPGCKYRNAFSQLFTPDHNYTMKKYSAMLSQFAVDRRGFFIMKITKADGLCCSEPLLHQTIGASSNLPGPSAPKAWFHSPIVSIPLTKDVKYRIVVHGVGDWELHWACTWYPMVDIDILTWWGGNVLPIYPRGKMWYGCNFQFCNVYWTEAEYTWLNFIIWE